MHTLDRKQKLLKNIDLSTMQGLEIGPLCWPLVSRDEANISYVDHVSTEELKKIYGADKGVALDSIVDVDYPLNNKSLNQAVGRKKFDYIIASHVIEHVPDVVTWLNDMASVLKPNGILTLAIPDKRYTFDIDREPSTLGDIVGPYIEHSTRPFASTTFNFVSLFRSKIDAYAIWDGELYLKPKAPNRYSLKDALVMSQDSAVKGIYVDTHCSVFTPVSFIEILRGLIELGLLDFKVSSFFDTSHGQYEFIISLQKIKKDIKAQHRSLPKLPQPKMYRELEAYAKSLEDKNTELLNELNIIKHTRSWRLTSPLRKGTTLMRHVRKVYKKKTS